MARENEDEKVPKIITKKKKGHVARAWGHTVGSTNKMREVAKF